MSTSRKLSQSKIIRALNPSKIDIKNSSIGSIVTQNVELERELNNIKPVDMNSSEVKIKPESATDLNKISKQDDIVLPDIKKKSDKTEFKHSSSKKLICKEDNIKPINESTFTIAGEKLADEENPYGVENKLLVKVHSHKSSFPINNMTKENPEDVALQKKNLRQIFESNKRKKLNDPYFANLFKSDRKVTNVIKNFDSVDKKGGYNHKIFKVYGINKLIPRYKKKNENDE